MHIDDKKTRSINYQNKIILAPMVRVGTLPMRLLALEFGADIVYSEELIDLRLIKCKRRHNVALDTIDFVDNSDGSIIFRTCPKEKDHVVLQMGTCDAARALEVGQLVQNDVAALDINMGCPKEFSIKGGMGAALLSQPKKAAHILRTLCENLKIPVTCKIRILPNLEDTIELVQELAATGIAAIAIHARTRDERPQHDAHTDFIREIAKTMSIPVIANGGSREIQNYGDILKFKAECGVKSVMIARAAQSNVSIFRKEGLLPINDVIVKYLKLCVDYDNPAHNSKYCIQNILKELQDTQRGKIFLQCQTLQQICDIWQLGDYCRQKQMEWKNRNSQRFHKINSEVVEVYNDENSNIGPHRKRLKKIDDTPAFEKNIIERNIVFLRSNYAKDILLPKTMLYTFSCKRGKKVPSYETDNCDKLFRSICTFDGKKYSSSFLEKNKKQAEQGAALVCLLNIGLVSADELLENGSLLR